MKINFKKTAERCRLANMAEVARQCGVTRVMSHQIAKGIYPYMQSDGAMKVISKLREMNLLVEETDDQVAA